MFQFSYIFFGLLSLHVRANSFFKSAPYRAFLELLELENDGRPFFLGNLAGGQINPSYCYLFIVFHLMLI